VGRPGRKPGAQTCRSGGLDRRGWRLRRSGQRMPCSTRAGMARKARARGDLDTAIQATQRGPETIEPRHRPLSRRWCRPELGRLGLRKVQACCARVALTLVVVAAKSLPEVSGRVLGSPSLGRFRFGVPRQTQSSSERLSRADASPKTASKEPWALSAPSGTSSTMQPWDVSPGILAPQIGPVGARCPC
jgi:hypothetical protein